MFEVLIAFLRSLTAKQIFLGQVKVRKRFGALIEFMENAAHDWRVYNWEIFLSEMRLTVASIYVWKEKTPEEREKDLIAAEELEYQSRRNSHDHWYSNAQWSSAQRLRERYALIDIFYVDEVLSDAIEKAGIKPTDPITDESLAKVIDAVRVIEAEAEAEAAV